MIGLTFANACSQPGIELVGTKVLLPNDSGKISRNMMPCTAPDVRAFMPTHTEIQQKHSANAMATPIAGEERDRVGLDAEADHVAEADEDHAQDQVAEEVGDHRADERRRARDRQRAEPVEHALLDVGVEVLAERDAAHRDALPEQAGQQELQVLVPRPPPPIAPPKTYTNSSRKMIGWTVTSISCSGVRIVLIRLRLARTSAWRRERRLPVAGRAAVGVTARGL